MVRLADGAERLERPRVEVGDEAEDSGELVAKDSRSEVSTINQMYHIEDAVVFA